MIINRWSFFLIAFFALESEGLMQQQSSLQQAVTVSDCGGNTLELAVSGSDTDVQNDLVSSALTASDAGGMVNEILKMAEAKKSQIQNEVAHANGSPLQQTMASMGLAPDVTSSCRKPLAVSTDNIANIAGNPVPVFGQGVLDDAPIFLGKGTSPRRKQRRYGGNKMFHSDQGDLHVKSLLPGKEGQLDLFQGDMIYRKIFLDSSSSSASASSGTVQWTPWNLWTGAKVNWYVDAAAPVDDCAISSFRTAVSLVEKYTCLRFKEGVVPSAGVNSVKLSSDSNSCWAYVGMSSDSQVNLGGSGCQIPGIAVHEIGHAVGLIHQQSRVDRDSFVHVDWDNIKSGASKNFQIIQSGSSYDTVVANIPYDYSSIMHYSMCEFSTTRSSDPCGRTLDPADESAAPNMGQREYLSQSDINTINQMYGCTSTCADGIQNQGEEGVDCGGPCRRICGDSTSDGIVVMPSQCMPDAGDTGLSTEQIFIIVIAGVGALALVVVGFIVHHNRKKARIESAKKTLLMKTKLTPEQLQASLKQRAQKAGIILRPSAPPPSD